MRINIKKVIKYLKEEKKNILFNKKYIKEMSLINRKNSLFIIEILLNKNEKINYFIKDIIINKKIEEIDYIIDIFENILYRISKEEKKYIFFI